MMTILRKNIHENKVHHGTPLNLLEYFEYSKKSEFDISDTEDDFNLDAFLTSNLTDLVKKTVEPVMADFIAKGTPEAVRSIHSRHEIIFIIFSRLQKMNWK